MPVRICFENKKNYYHLVIQRKKITASGMLRHVSLHNLHNLAKWHLKRIVLISRHETWQTVSARWP